MTADEIFNEISYHMIEGVMLHSQMVDYFEFLGFKGYSQCHLYHFFCENKNYKCICKYYLKHYNKLLAEDRINNPALIPSDWIQYQRQQVSPQVRKTALQSGIERWVDWEHKTKKIYEQYYNMLISLNEVAAAIKLKEIIKDVDYELAEAKQELLELQAIDFDITVVMDYQYEMKKKYKKKLKEIKIC